MSMHPVRLCCENSEYPDIPAFCALPVGRLNAQNANLFFSEPIGVDSWGLMIDARVPQETVDEPDIGGRFWPILSSRTA
jgi:hypothetical protein